MVYVEYYCLDNGKLPDYDDYIGKPKDKPPDDYIENMASAQLVENRNIGTLYKYGPTIPNIHINVCYWEIRLVFLAHITYMAKEENH